jgi:geranylgeranyl pyrophosphate synthase
VAPFLATFYCEVLLWLQSGATNEKVEACEKFALDVGLDFQVAVDILDVTGSTEELCKTATKDLDADKATYVRLLGLDGARAEHSDW